MADFWREKTKKARPPLGKRTSVTRGTTFIHPAVTDKASVSPLGLCHGNGCPVRWFNPSAHSETICKEILGLLPPATSSLDKD